MKQISFYKNGMKIQIWNEYIKYIIAVEYNGKQMFTL
jgi:hypothetical protein